MISALRRSLCTALMTNASSTVRINYKNRGFSFRFYFSAKTSVMGVPVYKVHLRLNDELINY